MSYLKPLMDMGFSEEKVKRALSATGNKGVEPAIDWLLAYATSMETSEDNSGAEAVGHTETPGTLKIKTEEQNVQDDGYVSALAKTLQCDGCNKKYCSYAEVEFHVIDTGHQNFSSSYEEIKPLTEDEKSEHRKKLLTIIKRQQAQMAEHKNCEVLRKEKSCKKTGQEITQVRQKQHPIEQIERDKQGRHEKLGMGTPTASTSTFAVPKAVSFIPAQTHDECNIQRTPSSSSKVSELPRRTARKSFSRGGRTPQNVPMTPGKRVRSPSSSSSVVNAQSTTSCLMPGQNSSDYEQVQHIPLKFSTENNCGIKKKLLVEKTPSEEPEIIVISDDDDDDDVDSAGVIESTGPLIDASLSDCDTAELPANSSAADNNLPMPICILPDTLQEGSLVWVDFHPNLGLFPLSWPGKIVNGAGNSSKHLEYVYIFGLQCRKWVHVNDISKHTSERLREAHKSTTSDARYYQALSEIQNEILLVSKMQHYFLSSPNL